MPLRLRDVKIVDNSKEVLELEKEAIEAILVAIGGEAEKYAKMECPVDTGRLRNSITFATATTQSEPNTNKHPKGKTDAEPSDYKMLAKPKENAVYIGTNVEYAPFIEYMDVEHKVGKPHFLRDAVTTHGDEYKRLAIQIGGDK